jgi:hypothetical protein
MSEALILEFRDASPDFYNAVNAILGLDPATGAGDWPDGLVSHTAGAHADGNGLTVFEVWDSQAAQGAFMESRLGPALGQAQIPEPSRLEWFTVVGHHGS